jgi:hypothetical protein
MQNFDFHFSVATGLRAQIASRAIEMPPSIPHFQQPARVSFPTRSNSVAATTRRDFPAQCIDLSHSPVSCEFGAFAAEMKEPFP